MRLKRASGEPAGRANPLNSVAARNHSAMPLSRRQLLARSGSVALAFAGLRAFSGRDGLFADEPVAVGYGPLVNDPNGILDLPAGFSYRLISTSGDTMDDGLVVPGAFDGMAAFAGADGRVILVRNHELDVMPERGAFAKDPAAVAKLGDKVYDPGTAGVPTQGGTTNLIWNPLTGKREKEFLSLAGTARNCAGGPTPWGSWISCEETMWSSLRPLSQQPPGIARVHGWCFEVPSTATGPVAPVPLTGLGRFNHEAIAIDPRTGVVYLTEDRPNGLIYRFIPKTPGRLLDGGRLQALAAIDRQTLDTRNWARTGGKVPTGEAMAVRWIDLEQTDSPDDNLRVQGANQGAARFARGEGMWFDRGTLWFTCTSGGELQHGQVWRYRPSPAEGTAGEASQPGSLELFIEPNDPSAVESCDNLTVAPWGDLILCEDAGGGGVVPGQRLVGVTPQGRCYQLGLNAQNKSEFAGVCFSPDGATLFANIQDGPARTLAISGPWTK